MSGLEVVAVVASIVSAYGAASALYCEWRRRKRKRKKELANKELKRLVKTSGEKVRGEYDRDFQRLGQAFAKGDEIGRVALMEQLITLQQTVIVLLSDKHAGDMAGAAVHPNHARIYQTSYSVQQESLAALGQLYQRLSVAAPINHLSSRGSIVSKSDARRAAIAASMSSRRTSTITRRRSADANIRDASSEVATGKPKTVITPTDTTTDPPIINSPTPSKTSNCGRKIVAAGISHTLGCHSFGWLVDHTIPLINCKVGGLTVCKSCWCQMFHYSHNDAKDGWRCSLCPGKTYSIHEWNRLRQHLVYNHSYLQVLPDRCVNGDPGCGR